MPRGKGPQRSNVELFPNRHRNKLCVILDSFALPHDAWKKGMTCAIEMYATGPVGVVVWLCTHDYGWSNGPTTTCSYVLARITSRRQLTQATQSTMTKYRTEFILIQDGPDHVERG